MDIELDYYLTFAAFLSTTFILIMPFQAGVKWLMTTLADAALPEAEADFFINKYLPELFSATRRINLPFAQRQDLFNKFIGMFMKIAFSFVFQEHVLPLHKLYNVPVLSIANYLMPGFNALASSISGFAQTDEAVVSGVNVFPGDERCRSYSPHAIWHEESASGFLELVFLADAINAILAQHA